MRSANFRDLTGQVFYKMTIISYVGRTEKGGNSKWLCKCECGNFKIIIGRNLLAGTTKSCGCYAKKVSSELKTTHGCSENNKTPEYVTWLGIKARCYNVNSGSYPHYGGRGITVCDEWKNSFQQFLKDMGKRPTPKHSIDRYPNNETGNYEPSNCRWATREEQDRNRRSNKWFEFDGENLILTDWARKLECDHSALSYMIKIKGSFELACIHYMNKKSKKQLQHNI